MSTMLFEEALKTLGLKLRPGDKVKCSPFNEANKANKRWHVSAMSVTGEGGRIEQQMAIERADWLVMIAWETLTKFYCRHCHHVVAPWRYHRHCPECGCLMRRKERQVEPEVVIIEERCRCGYEDIGVID